jgi:serine/threonine protein kinase
MTSSSKQDWKYKDFKMVKLLGTGAQSFVKLAFHKPTKQYFALKILPKHYYVIKRQVDYAYNEKNLLPLCVSPFSVHYHGSFQTQDFLYLVLEYVQGAELFDFILLSEKGLSLSLIRFFSAQIILFLEHVHKQNMIYCDLKPENVMITSNGYIKMVDFGLTARLDKHGKKTDACGTLSYFCPSKLRDEIYDVKSDVWSLGVVLYEMLTNRLLFSGNTKEEILAELTNHRIIYPKDSPALESEEVRNLVSKLLIVDPHKRPNLDQVKKHAFFKDVSWTKLAAQKIEIRSATFNDLAKRYKEFEKIPRQLESLTSTGKKSPKSISRKSRSQRRSIKNVWKHW